MDDISITTYCTLYKSKQFCNCKDTRNRLTFTKLNELHEKLFNAPIDNTRAHNSCYDVEMCAKCYF